MFCIGERSLLVKIDDIPPAEQEDLADWFDRRDGKGLVDMGDGRYTTADRLKDGLEPDFLTVPYGPDMFFLARKLGSRYAAAVDQAGEPVCVLEWVATAYIHEYSYSGTLDMRLLDSFDCLLLYDCNEYAVELVNNVLQFWQGRRLVMVGQGWEGLLPLLPDLEQVECFYEPRLSDDRLLLLGQDVRCLHVVAGIPHREPLRRWEKGILLYDELMSFLFLFSKCTRMGPLHPDKKFFLVDGTYDNLGLFALFNKTTAVSRYVKSCGFIPVVRLKCGGTSFYQNHRDDDIWAKFFNQPEGYTLEEALNSQNVYEAPVFYNGDIQSYIMNQIAGDTELSWPDGVYNPAMMAYFRQREERFLPRPDRTLGVLARGTDYVKSHLANHPIHASVEVLCHKIDELWQAWGGFDQLYLATEDADYCAYFQSRYGDRVTFTDQERYSTKPGEMLSEMQRERADRRDGFLLGAEYALSIRLLARCRSLIASGGCGGVDEALKQNQGRYEHVFVFDLGEN